MSLIKEFAIEPRVMATWEHFNSLWEDFGVGHGRLIAKYPVLWKNKVDELARQCSRPIRAASISSKIRRDEHKFIETGRTYNGQGDWLTSAVSQMATNPFHAVIASENPKGAAGVLVAGEFAKDEVPYKVVCEDFVPRTAPALADSASLLLANCTELQFVDPYFDPSASRFRNTFRFMLRQCNPGFLKVVEIHCEKTDPYLPGVQRANFRQFLAEMVPRKATLRVLFWSQKPAGMEMHPRFLLTDLGGMNFENGLDTGEPGLMTLVKPLSHEVWQKCRGFYSPTSGSFALTPDCMVDIPGEG